MSKTTKSLSIVLTLIVGIALSFTLSTDTAFAAPKAPSKPGAVKVTSKTTNSVTLKWGKSKNANGYQIYMNGSPANSVSGGKTVNFTKKGLGEGTNYKFKVRAYRSIKTTKWYNKKTKKWQNKKPAKKYRGKKKVVTTKKYSGFTGTLTAKTNVESPSGSGGNSPQIVSGSLTVGTVPAYVNKYNDSYVAFTKPCNGTISYSSNNSNVVSVSQYSTDKAKLRGGNAAGTATITATFTPAGGYNVTGNKTVTFSVKNSVFPCNADGSYSLADSNYRKLTIGGISAKQTEISLLPNGSTIHVSSDNMNRFDPIYDDVTAHNHGTNWYDMPVAHSTNKNVIRILKENSVSELMMYPNNVYFIGSGSCDVTLANGNVLHVVATGSNHTEMAALIDFMMSVESETANMSEFNKVSHIISKLQNLGWSYGDTSVEYLMWKFKKGDCGGGNRLLASMCEISGIDAKLRYAANDGGGVGTYHQNCRILIDETVYIGDFTPGRVCKLYTQQEYKQSHPNYVIE